MSCLASSDTDLKKKLIFLFFSFIKLADFRFLFDCDFSHLLMIKLLIFFILFSFCLFIRLCRLFHLSIISSLSPVNYFFFYLHDFWIFLAISFFFFLSSFCFGFILQSLIFFFFLDLFELPPFLPLSFSNILSAYFALFFLSQTLSNLTFIFLSRILFCLV